MLVACRFAVFGGLFLALSGCVPEGVGFLAPPPAQQPAPLCSAGIYDHLVGQPVRGADAVPEPRRIIRPGDLVTTDHNPARTNLEVDGADVITRVFCG